MNSMDCSYEQSVKKVMPDDHSKLAPLLPIPNRTVKRLRADDSADSRVKVGHRQAPYAPARISPLDRLISWAFFARPAWAHSGRCKSSRKLDLTQYC